MNRTLENAFRATTYRVETDVGVFDLRIDETNAPFEAWLRRGGVACWSMLTACNPGGVRSDRDNATRQAKLLACVQACGYLYFPACHLADDRSWPDEPSLLLLNVKDDEVRLLAREFSQLAFVAGEVGRAPRLVWTRDVGRNASLGGG